MSRALLAASLVITACAAPTVTTVATSPGRVRLEADPMREGRAAGTESHAAPPSGTAQGRAHTASSTVPPPANRASRSRVSSQPPPPPGPAGTPLSSTAYCETGRMASGKRTYPHAVAGNRWPIGTILDVSDAYGPGRYVVEDRIGHGSELDFAIPGDCAAARRWGRRTVTAEVAR